MAKTLYLARHAKSSWSDMSHGDFDRPLNKRGLHDAPEMGHRLVSRGVHPDIILCSPARRTRQTVELLLKAMDIPTDSVEFDERIYEASMDALLHILRSLPDGCASAMLIGHNPSIGSLANHLSDVLIDRMPTSAIATLELATSRWDDIGACTARLLDFDYPKKG